MTIAERIKNEGLEKGMQLGMDKCATGQQEQLSMLGCVPAAGSPYHASIMDNFTTYMKSYFDSIRV